MKASITDYEDISRQTKNLTSKMKAFIMAQETPVTAIGSRICVTLPLEMVSNVCKEWKDLKQRRKK